MCLISGGSGLYLEGSSQWVPTFVLFYFKAKFPGSSTDQHGGKRLSLLHRLSHKFLAEMGLLSIWDTLVIPAVFLLIRLVWAIVSSCAHSVSNSKSLNHISPLPSLHSQLPRLGLQSSEVRDLSSSVSSEIIGKSLSSTASAVSHPGQWGQWWVQLSIQSSSAHPANACCCPSSGGRGTSKSFVWKGNKNIWLKEGTRENPAIKTHRYKKKNMKRKKSRRKKKKIGSKIVCFISEYLWNHTHIWKTAI